MKEREKVLSNLLIDLDCFFVFPLLDREFVWALWLFDWWLVIIRLGVTFVIILWLLFLEFVVVAKAFFGVRNNLISFVKVDFHHYIYWINTSTYTYLHIYIYICICAFVYIFFFLLYHTYVRTFSYIRWLLTLTLTHLPDYTTNTFRLTYFLYFMNVCVCIYSFIYR